MDAFASASPDEFSLSVESPFDSDADEEEEFEDEYMWTMQLKVPDTSESVPEANCLMFEPSHRIQIDDVNAATCSGFSMDSNWLAVGTRNGPIQIYSVSDGRLAFTLDVLKGGFKRWPCTALCVRPSSPGDSSYNVLLSCDLNGQIHFWHMTSGMHLGTSKEQGNSTYAIDFHSAGVKYATSGSDTKVRVYDASTCKLVQILSEGNGTTTVGHSNRVFAVKWHPEDANTVLTGGWDNTIQIWDLRAAHSIRSIYGPRVYGNAIDIKATGDVILSGSWSQKEQLQEWDFGSGKLLKNYFWTSNMKQPCQVYAAKYGRGISQGLVVAGGSGSNETYLFSVETGQVVARDPDDGQATYSLCVSTDGSLMAAATANTVCLFDMKEQLSSILGESESQFKTLVSPAKTRKLSKLSENTKGESKLTALQTGARIFKHTGTLPSSNKRRLSTRTRLKSDQATVSR